MERANKKFNISAAMGIISGVVIILAGVTCGVLSIISGAMVIGGKKELEI